MVLPKRAGAIRMVARCSASAWQAEKKRPSIGFQPVFLRGALALSR
jgi:hypothetical protein